MPRYAGISAPFLIGLAFLACFGGTSLPAEAPKDKLQKLVIPLDRPSSAVDLARANLDISLAEIKSRAKTPPRSLLTKTGSFVLYGDLFKTGHCFALFEPSVKSDDEVRRNNGTLALAEWVNEKWELRGLWTIPITWRLKGWKWNGKDGDDYLPITPATKPFELVDLSGDGVPEVVVAGEVEKYYQSYYLLRFEPKTHGLALLADAMGKPELAGKYVRLYSNSGRRAIYEEWEYLQWVNDKLVRNASWHDEVPYNNIDPHFILADVTGDDGQNLSFRITDADSDSENESVYTLTKDDKPYATLVIAWRKSLVRNVDLAPNEVGQAWLFEKITGLARDLYPRPHSVKKLVRLEDHATVRVTGSDEAIHQLSLKPARR